MKTEIKHQVDLLIALKKVFALSPELVRHPKISKHLPKSVDGSEGLDDLLSDAGAIIASLNLRGKPRPLTSMSPDEFRECFKEPGFTDEYCRLRIDRFNSVYVFFTFLSQYAQADSLQWLHDKGFDIFNVAK